MKTETAKLWTLLPFVWIFEKKLQITFFLILYSSNFFAQNGEIKPIVQLGHQDIITTMKISEDGLKLASGDSESHIKIWDVPSRRLIQQLSLHQGAVSCLLFNDEADVLFSGSLDHTVIAWDLKTGQNLGNTFGKDKIIALGLSKEEQFLYSVSRDAQIILWDWKNNKKLDSYFLDIKGSIEKAAFCRKKNLLIIGTLQGAIILWDLTLKKEIRKKKFSRYAIASIAIHPREEMAAIATRGEQKAFLMSLTNFEDTKNLEGLSGWNYVNDATFSSDGQKIAMVGGEFPNDDMAMIWNVYSQEVIHNVNGGSFGNYSVQFSHDGKEVILGNWVGDLGSIHLNTLQLSRYFGGEIERFRKVQFDAKGEKVLLYGNTIKLWDLKTGTVEEENEVESEVNHQIEEIDYIFDLEEDHLFLEDSLVLVMGRGANDKKTLSLIDLKMGQIKQNYSLHDSNAELMVVCPNNKFFTTVTTRSGRTVLDLWELGNSRKVHRLSGHKEEIYFTAFNANSQLLVSAAKKTNDFFLWSPVFSEIIFWNTRTGKKVKRLKLPSNIYLETISPEHKYLAAIRNYTDVVVFNMNNGKKKYTFLNSRSPVFINAQGLKEKTISPYHHTEYVDNLEFSKKGTYLIATYSTGRIRIWEMKSGKEIFSYDRHDTSVNSIDVSPDGKLLVSASDEKVVLWDLSEYTINLFYLINSRYLASLTCVGGERNGYVVFSDHSKGYYMANKNALDAVHFVVDGKPYQFDQFDLYFNRPHEVMSRFPLSDESLVERYRLAYQAHLRTYGLTEEEVELDLHTPELEIGNLAELTSIQYQRDISIQVTARDSRYNFRRMLIYVNGILHPNNFQEELKGKMETNLEIPLVLSDGSNRIQLAVENEKGILSLKVSFEVKYNGPPDTPDYYLVSIGTSKYNSTYLDNLYYPSIDAEAIAEHLRLKIPSANTLVLTDENFSLNFIDTIEQFLTPTDESDIVIFYLSGHGVLYEDADYYYCTTKTELSNLAETAIPYRSFEELLAKSKSRKKLLILSSCFSGRASLAKTFEEKIAFDLSQSIFVNYQSSDGSSIISSSEGHEATKEIKGTLMKNGLIASAMIKALKIDQSFTVSQFFDFIRNDIQELPPLFIKKLPVLRVENLLNDFELW